ncbi:hypothetical protein DUI87_00933 [Hirundo rustica rustica]|uniref:Uncharacterized protein n=1 Tax=Hirundo rustica rustica TaxID=333673 RepID=A0A3M0LM05_HIRRU|nr:hypothetical protein DUI87_00933 [Hirundo rustica rustica]
MFKGKVPSTHHATDATWSKWIALITQRARIGNPNRPGILEIITNWPEGENFGLMDEEEQEQVTRAEEAPPYNQLPAEETRYALFTDGSCRIVGMNRKWKAAVWSPTRQVAQATEGEGGSSQLAELKAVQLALDIAEREKWPKLYLYTDSWMVANALWGWLDRWKKANWQRRGKPIWAADEWKDIATRVEKLPVKVRHVDAHVPKSRANEEHQNNEQVDHAAKIEVSKIDLDWQHKGELFLARWAHDASGHQGRDATYKWAQDRGVDLTMDSISQVIHDCETCAAIKQAKRVKPLWYGGRWSKYKYGEAWQIDYVTLPQTRQGKRYVLTMVEATTGWLETYPVPHATARNTILGLEKQILWRHGTPERIESDNGTHFKNSLINTWAREHGIEWVYHIPYHAPAAGKVERCNGLLKTTLKALGAGTFKNWENNLAKATWLQLTEGLHLKDDNWNFVSVDNSEQGTWPRVKGKLIVVGDCKHTPKEIKILPGTFDNNPGKFVLWLRCTHPPTFLPKGKIVAQIIPTWEHLEEDNIPTACPVHNITEVKPQVGCELQVGDEAINITGLLDTGTHVTVIPAKHWPSRWALENVAGHVQGIGGMQLAKQSKSVVQIKGPKGQLASLRPFVLDYREPLLGRDLMAQWGVTIDIPDPPQDFWAAVAEERPTHKLNWKTDAPVWVEQWPLSKQKLKALEELVEEQLAKGHIVETTSPWNSPVFVIRKPGKDKWRLLQDLRQINNVIEDIGSLQPGMPTPTMLPQNWKLAVIDIKDCFFHIPLHPDDAPRFAFSVPTVNREAPRKRYHWRVLPQGMKVSPIICQWYVASLLSPVRVAAEKAIIHHYMDDVLVCAPTNDVLSHALDLTINALVVAGFELQEDKVQRMPPWRYLGLEIGKRTIVPQKLEIKAKIQTLADVHQLCGALNWVRPWLGLTTEDLAPLFNLLKGGEELSSPRELTPEAKEALEKVQHLMSTRQAHRCDPDLPFKFIIMGKLPHLHGVIFQWRNNIKKDQGREDPLLIIEWVFLSHQRSKRMTRPQELVAELIRKARVRIRELAGCDFECIHIPIGLRSGQITKAMLEHLLQENEALQFALDSFTGQISIHRPAHKIFNQDAKFTLNLKDVRSRKPLEALTVFTDASGKSHKSVMTWKDPQTQQWEADVAEVEGSPQVAELAAVVRAFERFPEPFNLVTDSAYVAGVVSRADQAILQEVSNTALFELLSKLVKLVSHREQPFFVMHTRSHTDLLGFIAEGNRRADALAAPAAMAPLPSIFEQAKLSHQFHHQNAPGLVRRFHITREQAKAIVATCPSCNQHALPTLSAGVNPRGLNSCELWQTDVTHIPQFGRSKYVHVSVDTFSGAVFASAHAGEKTSDAIKHLIQAFSFMGIPKELKTDNGPAYRSKEFCGFLQQWGVGYKTGIPHSPTGQAVVERTHREIKRVLNQQQLVLKTETPQTRLARALFTLNFLNSTFEFLNPPIVRHFGANPQLNIKERPPVMVRDPETGRTEGPHDLVTWGRGILNLTPLNSLSDKSDSFQWKPILPGKVEVAIRYHNKKRPDMSKAFLSPSVAEFLLLYEFLLPSLSEPQLNTQSREECGGVRPQEYSSALAIMKQDETEETVLDIAKKLQTYADAMHSPTHARIAALETRMKKLENKIEENHKELKQDILQISAVQVKGSGTTRKRSLDRERKSIPRAKL